MDADPITSSNEPDAGFARALTLLSKVATRDEVNEAISLLEQASTRGHGGASERLAIIEAVGMMRPASWERSLDYLQLAAEQGLEGAQAQLSILALDAFEPDAPARASRDWRALRDRVDLSARLQSPPYKLLSQAPLIRSFSGFASPAECLWLIELARSRTSPAPLIDTATGGEAYASHRDNSFMGLRLDLLDVVTEVVRHRIGAAIHLPVTVFEPAQLLHYAVGQQFRPHHDFLDPKVPGYRESLARFGQRIGTLLIYLNDGYEGGETAFPAVGLSFRGTRGDALFFANVDRQGNPELRSLHAGLPPTSGEKWILSQWIRDRIPSR